MSVNIKSLDKINDDLANSNNTCELLIVTKNRSEEDIKLLLNLGYTTFGENRIQEAKKKFTQFENYNFDLHLIGPLQSNKCEIALNLFDTIQSVDRKKIIDMIHDISSIKEGLKTKFFYLQVNIGKEIQKNGIIPDEIDHMYEYSLKKGLNIVGLMCIPPNIPDPSEYFDKMLEIRNKINNKLRLSMGMSNDYEYALKKKSNMIRVGSKIFDD